MGIMSFAEDILTESGGDCNCFASKWVEQGRGIRHGIGTEGIYPSVPMWLVLFQQGEKLLHVFFTEKDLFPVEHQTRHAHHMIAFL